MCTRQGCCSKTQTSHTRFPRCFHRFSHYPSSGLWAHRLVFCGPLKNRLSSPSIQPLLSHPLEMHKTLIACGRHYVKKQKATEKEHNDQRWKHCKLQINYAIFYEARSNKDASLEAICLERVSTMCVASLLPISACWHSPRIAQTVNMFAHLATGKCCIFRNQYRYRCSLGLVRRVFFLV